MHLEAGKPRQPQPCQGQVAQGVAIADQQVAPGRFVFILDARERPVTPRALVVEVEAVVPGQFGRRHRHAVAGQVGRRRHHVMSRVAELACHQPGVLQRTAADRHVGTGFQQVHHRIGEADVEAHLRVKGEELRQHRDQVLPADGHVAADAHPPMGPRTGPGLALGLGEVGEDAQAALVEALAFRRQPQAPGGAVEQSRTKPRLQPRHQLADRRRCHPAGTGGRGETAGFHHADEDVHLAEAVDIGPGHMT